MSNDVIRVDFVGWLVGKPLIQFSSRSYSSSGVSMNDIRAICVQLLQENKYLDSVNWIAPGWFTGGCITHADLPSSVNNE